MKKIITFLILLNSFLATPLYAITVDEMEKVVTNIDGIILLEQRKGYIVLVYKKVKMALVSDEEQDRMRLIAAVAKYSHLSLDQISNAMYSNFHNAMDARYAESKDVLYASYVHSISHLSEEELKLAFDQVASLSLTFDKTYTAIQN